MGSIQRWIIEALGGYSIGYDTMNNDTLKVCLEACSYGIRKGANSDRQTERHKTLSVDFNRYK